MNLGSHVLVFEREWRGPEGLRHFLLSYTLGRPRPALLLDGWCSHQPMRARNKDDKPFPERFASDALETPEDFDAGGSLHEELDDEDEVDDDDLDDDDDDLDDEDLDDEELDDDVDDDDLDDDEDLDEDEDDDEYEEEDDVLPENPDDPDVGERQR